MLDGNNHNHGGECNARHQEGNWKQKRADDEDCGGMEKDSNRGPTAKTPISDARPDVKPTCNAPEARGNDISGTQSLQQFVAIRSALAERNDELAQSNASIDATTAKASAPAMMVGTMGRISFTRARSEK